MQQTRIIDAEFQDRIRPGSDAKYSLARPPGWYSARSSQVAFLASEDSTFVSGRGLLVDDGCTLALVVPLE